MTQRPTRVHYFSDPLPDDCADPKALLGGKGASLMAMSRAGLRVPPGFTIAAECCAEYFAAGRRWPEGLETEVRANLERLEQETGRRFGRGDRPLLVSVRSGAAVSMPGMMDTLLNCGLHPALADDVGDTPQFWSLYLEFIRMFARTVHGLGEEALAPGSGEGERRENAPADRAAAEAHLAAYHARTGRTFPTEPWDALRQCINAVFESWENERAVAYRRRNDIRGLSGTAVNVQMMFPSEVSGIVFTHDPNRPASGRMIVEASYGLGEAVVSGDVTPDRFVVSRDDFDDVQAEIGHKHRRVSALGQPRTFNADAPCLSRDQLAELCRLCLEIEAHFGHPVDVEWGLAEGRFALLQARAIRGLDVLEEVEVAREDEIFRLRSLAGGGRKVWVAHNLGETLPCPTPLTWDIVRQFMSGSGGFGRMYRDLGYRPSKEVSDQGFLDLVCGRVYADPDRLAQLFWDGMPLGYDLDALLADQRLLDRAPTKFDSNKAHARFLATLPRNLVAMLRAARRMKRSRRDAKRRFEQEALPPFLEYVRAKRGQDLATLSDAALVAELDQRRRRVLYDFGPESLRPGFFGGLAFDALATMLAQLGGPDEGEALAGSLTRGLEGDTTFEQDAMLYRVATGDETIEAFLERFGHRATGEMELAVPRWREDPTYPRQMAARMRQADGRTPEAIHHENVARRRQTQDALPDILARWGGSCFLEPIRADLDDAQALLPYRESGKHYLMMGYELLRHAIEELARRSDLGAGVYYLHLDELARAPRDRSHLENLIVDRRLRHQALRRLDPADVIDSHDLDGLGLAQAVEAADRLQGAAVASGVAAGPARIVLNPAEADHLGTGYVLVCPSTDPGWTPLFLGARALVVERGGVLSHGAIVARDFGIPAVVCPAATRRIPDGAEIRVDGNNGHIDLLTQGDPHA